MPMIWVFAVLLAFFHSSEFALAFVFQRQDLSLSSTLLSWEYVAAMAIAVAEHLAEQRLQPALKSSHVSHMVSGAGLTLALVGEALRKAAILTARGNFTHLVRFERHDRHVLVRHGVYAWVRHPGYLGFLLWAAGTQLLLANPACLVLFVAAVWTFFRRRVPVEEQQLMKFFGRAYGEYRVQVPSGLPFIF